MDVSYIEHQLPVSEKIREQFQLASAEDKELRLVSSERMAKLKEPSTKAHSPVLDIYRAVDLYRWIVVQKCKTGSGKQNEK